MFDETGRDIFVADGIHYLQKLPKFGLEAGTGRIRCHVLVSPGQSIPYAGHCCCRVPLERELFSFGSLPVRQRME